MAACTKVAAFGALLRVLYVAFGTSEWDWRPMICGVAILTMLVGAVLGGDPDRHQAAAGLLVDRPRRVHPRRRARPSAGPGLSATMFYLLAYGFTTIAAFAVVTLVRDDDGEATHLSSWAGLGRALAADRRRFACSCSRSPASR